MSFFSNFLFLKKKKNNCSNTNVFRYEDSSILKEMNEEDYQISLDSKGVEIIFAEEYIRQIQCLIYRIYHLLSEKGNERILLLYFIDFIEPMNLYKVSSLGIKYIDGLYGQNTKQDLVALIKSARRNTELRGYIKNHQKLLLWTDIDKEREIITLSYAKSILEDIYDFVLLKEKMLSEEIGAYVRSTKSAKFFQQYHEMDKNNIALFLSNLRVICTIITCNQSKFDFAPQAMTLIKCISIHGFLNSTYYTERGYKCFLIISEYIEETPILKKILQEKMKIHSLTENNKYIDLKYFTCKLILVLNEFILQK